MGFGFGLLLISNLIAIVYCDSTQLQWKLVRTLPHDPNAFTQGFMIDPVSTSKKLFLEGTGLTGRSNIRRVDLETGTVLHSKSTPNSRDFGEGITVFNGKIYQLTWQNKRVYRWSFQNFTLEQTYSWQSEGWGITTDSSINQMIVSDGSDQIYFVDGEMKIIRTMKVTDGSRSISRLNELELIQGRIWANVWMTNSIVIIDPSSGHVLHTLDMSSLPRQQGADVLNGIAYDHQTKKVYVTGKLWNSIYEIAFESRTMHHKLLGNPNEDETPDITPETFDTPKPRPTPHHISTHPPPTASNGATIRPTESPTSGILWVMLAAVVVGGIILYMYRN